MKMIRHFFILFFLISSSVYADATKPEIKTYTQDKSAIMVNSDNPVFVIKLKSNPTTGYSWFLREYYSTILEPIKHEFEAPINKKLMGAPGYELWTFRVKPAGFMVPQQTVIRFIYLRPWEAAESSTQVLFKITTFNNNSPQPKK